MKLQKSNKLLTVVMMLKIGNTSWRNVDDLCDKHYDSVSAHVMHILNNIVNKRYRHAGLNGTFRSSIETKKKTLLSHSKKVFKNLIRFAYNMLDSGGGNLRALITCKPDDFTEIYNRLNLEYSFDEEVPVKNKNEKVMYPLLQAIFNYEHLRSGIKIPNGITYSAFNLVEKIGLNTCPYCNRQYITIVEKGEKRPPLDHFYPRSKYPIFGISFYNLIPSCYQCNSYFKSDKDTKTEDYLHPYKEGFMESARFRYKPGTIHKTMLKIVELDSARRARIEKTSDRFEIEEVYKSHEDVAREIHHKSLRNPKEYAESIEKITQMIGSITGTKEEFYQFYFGNYMNEINFEKRPLAKFTSDLIDELQIMRLYEKH